MRVSTEEIRLAEDAVISEVQASDVPVRPIDVIDVLRQRMPEDLVRFVIWQLIDRNRIVLDRNLLLAMPERQPVFAH